MFVTSNKIIIYLIFIVFLVIEIIRIYVVFSDKFISFYRISIYLIKIHFKKNFWTLLCCNFHNLTQFICYSRSSGTAWNFTFLGLYLYNLIKLIMSNRLFVNIARNMKFYKETFIEEFYRTLLSLVIFLAKITHPALWKRNQESILHKFKPNFAAIM